MSSGKTALITGCSSGIGRATALRLDASGWKVYAGVRKPADAESLASEGSELLTPLILDVTDEETIEDARRAIDAEGSGGLDALVNNAGVAYTGPLEFVPLDDLRQQLEVNLIGHLATTQAMLPALRTAEGRVVNVTSIGGIVATPFFGPYNASKFALEAISDCLRVELRPWGIKTITIEPGSIATEIWASGTTTSREVRERMKPEAEGLYGKAMEATERASAETGARGIAPEKAAATIEGALNASHPRARYLIGRDAYGMAGAKLLLPARIFDWVIGRALRLP